jgi:hypothetical protein
MCVLSRFISNECIWPMDGSEELMLARPDTPWCARGKVVGGEIKLVELREAAKASEAAELADTRGHVPWASSNTEKVWGRGWL